MSTTSATSSGHLPSSVLILAPEKHEDDRGWLFEIVNRTLGFEPKQVYAVHCRPWKPRGAHFHRRKSEVFAVVSGSCRLRWRAAAEDVRGPQDRRGEVQDRLLGPAVTAQAVFIPPGVWHEFEAIPTTAHPEGAVVIAVADEWYDPNDEDTYRDGEDTPSTPPTPRGPAMQDGEYHDG